MYVYVSREIVVSNLKNGNRTKVTPKLHFAEGHGPEALERHPDVLLLKKEWNGFIKVKGRRVRKKSNSSQT